MLCAVLIVLHPFTAGIDDTPLSPPSRASRVSGAACRLPFEDGGTASGRANARHCPDAYGIDGLFGKTNAGHLNITPAGLVGCVDTVCASEPGHPVWLKRQVESDR